MNLPPFYKRKKTNILGKNFIFWLFLILISLVIFGFLQKSDLAIPQEEVTIKIKPSNIVK